MTHTTRTTRSRWPLVLVASLVAAPTHAQEPPRSYLGSWEEMAAEYLSGVDNSAPFYAIFICPTENEWARNLFHRLIEAEWTQDRIHVWALTWANDLERCPYEPLHQWVRDALFRAQRRGAARSLADGIARSWRPTDRALLIEYAASDLSNDTKSVGLRNARSWMDTQERIDLFFDLFQAGPVPYGYFESERLHFGSNGQWGDPEALAVRGAAAVRARPDHPQSPELLAAIVDLAGMPEGYVVSISDQAARAVRQAMTALEGRPAFAEVFERIPSFTRTRILERTGGGER